MNFDRGLLVRARGPTMAATDAQARDVGGRSPVLVAPARGIVALPDPLREAVERSSIHPLNEITPTVNNDRGRMVLEYRVRLRQNRARKIIEREPWRRAAHERRCTGLVFVQKYNYRPMSVPRPTTVAFCMARRGSKLRSPPPAVCNCGRMVRQLPRIADCHSRSGQHPAGDTLGRSGLKRCFPFLSTPSRPPEIATDRAVAVKSVGADPPPDPHDRGDTDDHHGREDDDHTTRRRTVRVSAAGRWFSRQLRACHRFLLCLRRLAPCHPAAAPNECRELAAWVDLRHRPAPRGRLGRGVRAVDRRHRSRGAGYVLLRHGTATRNACRRR